jgi:hypothetical protein
MITAQPKTQIVEKIIRNNSGQVFRGYFLVAEFEGEIFWKLIRAEKIERLNTRDPIFNNSGNFLPIFQSKNFVKITGYKLQTVISPYILNTFFTSQMTRAPSQI